MTEIDGNSKISINTCLQKSSQEGKSQPMFTTSSDVIINV